MEIFMSKQTDSGSGRAGQGSTDPLKNSELRSQNAYGAYENQRITYMIQVFDLDTHVEKCSGNACKLMMIA